MKVIALISMTILFVRCSDDDETVDSIEYRWPVWSPDNAMVIADYRKNAASANANAPITIALHTVATGNEQYINVSKIDLDAQVQLSMPYENTLLMRNNGIRVFDTDGTIRSDILTLGDGVTPQCIAFSKYDRFYYWASSQNGILRAGAVYDFDSLTLAPVTEITVLDSSAAPQVIDIVETRLYHCALLLSDGTILSINTSTGTYTTHSSSILSSTDISQEKLYYLAAENNDPGIDTPDYLYFLDATGLCRWNLVSDEKSTILSAEDGYLLSYDVDPNTRTLLFVTSGSQVWLANEHGTPTQVLFFEHTMARFSPNGKSVVAIGYDNTPQNTLSILQIRQ